VVDLRRLAAAFSRPDNDWVSRVTGRLLVGVLFAVGIASLARADGPAESLVELARTTREYQDSLAKVLALNEQEVARAEANAERYRRLLPDGLVSRRDVEAAEHAAADARSRADDTRARIAGADQVLVEARAMLELASLPPPAPGEERETASVVEYHGVTRWTLAQAASLEEFFEARFGRRLPISALGQTAVHDHLRFDHRNALDVAVHPDSREGRALLEYLRSRGIPFLAFRGPVAGASTGAHVHVGAPSHRLS
jgi:hypothetical protein